jgi:hypothetical protein
MVAMTEPPDPSGAQPDPGGDQPGQDPVSRFTDSSLSFARYESPQYPAAHAELPYRQRGRAPLVVAALVVLVVAVVLLVIFLR